MRMGFPFAGRRGGVLAKLLAVLVVFLAVATLGWMLLLPAIVTKVLQTRTQFGVTVQSLTANPFTGTVHLRGLTIENPPAFPTPDFVQVREFRATAGMLSLFGSRPVIDEAVVDVALVTLVKNQAGVHNAALLQERLAGGGGGQSGAGGLSAAGPAPNPREFLIRRLELRFDKLRLVDASRGQPVTQEYDLGIRQTYVNVTTPVQIAVPILTKLNARGGAIGDFAGRLGADALAMAKKTGELLKDTGKEAGAAIKGLFQSLEQKAKK
jgi:uncharacterized protein involved in outer membrane biogenesis